ncbi:unnamed protein product [Prunus armeniaca]
MERTLKIYIDRQGWKQAHLPSTNTQGVICFRGMVLETDAGIKALCCEGSTKGASILYAIYFTDARQSILIGTELVEQIIFLLLAMTGYKESRMRFQNGFEIHDLSFHFQMNLIILAHVNTKSSEKVV